MPVRSKYSCGLWKNQQADAAGNEHSENDSLALDGVEAVVEQVMSELREISTKALAVFSAKGGALLDAI